VPMKSPRLQLLQQEYSLLMSLFQLEQGVFLLPYNFLLVVLVQVPLVVLHPGLCILRKV